MSTSYYLVQTEPTLVYGRAKVAQTSGGKAHMWPYDPMNGWVNADGDQLFAPDLTVPKTVADLKALVASGRYRFVDEYWEEHDVEEVFGE